MGANEKHAATYHGVRHDPDLNLVRTVYAGASPVPSYDDRAAAFDRMIAKVRAEAKAEALMEAAHAIASAEINLDVFEGQEYLKELWAHSNQTRVGIVTSLRARANQYKENQS